MKKLNIIVIIILFLGFTINCHFFFKENSEVKKENKEAEVINDLTSKSLITRRDAINEAAKIKLKKSITYFKKYNIKP